MLSCHTFDQTLLTFQKQQKRMKWKEQLTPDPNFSGPHRPVSLHLLVSPTWRVSHICSPHRSIRSCLVPGRWRLLLLFFYLSLLILCLLLQSTFSALGWAMPPFRVNDNKRSIPLGKTLHPLSLMQPLMPQGLFGPCGSNNTSTLIWQKNRRQSLGC